MEEEAMEEDTGRTDRRATQTELPPNGIGVQPRTRGTSANATSETPATSRVTPHVIVTHLRFCTQDPPTIPHKERIGTLAANVNKVEHQNRFTPLKDQGSASRGRDNKVVSFGILREGSISTASSSRGSRGRDPIPLTPRSCLYWIDLNQKKGSGRGS